MTERFRRRDFLHPGRLLTGAHSLHRQVFDRTESISPESPHDAVTATLSRSAMACRFEIQIAADSAGRQLAAQAFDWIDEIEARLTVYRDDSDIAKLNGQAGECAVAVDAELFCLLERCVQLHGLTNGAFDVTSGPLIRTWGFLRRQGRLPGDEEIAAALAKVGSDKLMLDASARTVRFAVPGMEINLGAIGKGYALDRIADRLRTEGLASALLSAGHSSVLAVGAPPWDRAWQVDLADPRDNARRLGVVRLKDQAMSTTGIAEQNFEVAGRTYGHVLDPRTGRPADGMLQATAIAGDAALAEALSTAFFVNGMAWTESFCGRHPEVAAIVLDNERGAPARFFVADI